MKKRGISLIVLIVTIIVVIILAAVVILTLSKNNPIESSKEAAFKEDVRTFQDELAMYIAKDYTAKAGARDDKITATRYEVIKEYISSFNENYKGKFVIKQDTLMYNEDNLNNEELQYIKDLNLVKNLKTGAEVVEDDPINSFGTRVMNYSSNGISDWKIFYSDGANVYIITSEYIELDKLPEKNDKKPENNDTTYNRAATLENILSEYNGSSDIIDERIKALNNDYFIINKFNSSYSNMKAVAYLLDYEIWSEFAKGKCAEYAIGSPTLELFLKSYSSKYKVDYRAKAKNDVGYLISNNGGNSWSTLSQINRDELYVQNSGAYIMWLASPSAENKNYLMNIFANGSLRRDGLNESRAGYRPIVCLKSDTMLKKVEGGYEIQ